MNSIKPIIASKLHNFAQFCAKIKSSHSHKPPYLKMGSEHYILVQFQSCFWGFSVSFPFMMMITNVRDIFAFISLSFFPHLVWIMLWNSQSWVVLFLVFLFVLAVSGLFFVGLSTIRRRHAIVLGFFLYSLLLLGFPFIFLSWIFALLSRPIVLL